MVKIGRERRTRDDPVVRRGMTEKEVAIQCMFGFTVIALSGKHPMIATILNVETLVSAILSWDILSIIIRQAQSHKREIVFVIISQLL
ncbi:hypothetical protein MRX96_059691 [Rhipicephalus microplus]